MFDNNIFDKFTNHLKNALQITGRLAKHDGSKIVEPIYLLRGILSQNGSLAAELLHKNGIHTESKEPVENFKQNIITLDLSHDAKKIITKMINLAFGYNYSYVGTEHLLMAILSLPDKNIEEMFKKNKVSVTKIKKHLSAILKSSSHFSEIENVLSDFFEGYLDTEMKQQIPQFTQIGKDKKTLLETFTTDLTAESVQKNIDPVVGREKEIGRLAQILSRRRKNNPLLLGDPGVGKTAIVEGLAKKILYGDVPDSLRNKKILSLDLSLMVAGTMYRGEFESRLKNLLIEIKNNPNLIIFIDEIHNIIGAGSTVGGTMDAANIIKPALARGEIRCIGATTQSEYHKYIESDPALERRFQTIQVEEPTMDESLQILFGLKKYYERFHNVNIDNSALQAAVDFSARYIPDKFLPDKAIDLIDEAASKIKIKTPVSNNLKALRILDEKLKNLQIKKTNAVHNEDYDRAIKINLEEKKLFNEIDIIKNKIKNEKSDIPIINKNDIAFVVSQITNIPLDYLLKENNKRITTLANRIKKKIIGQDRAVDFLVSILKTAQIGLNNSNRPLGSFLFLGPSGVGKTEIAKVLAKEYFGDENSLIRIDMSEFSESFNASKLIGAPAGYVGYQEGGKITNIVRRRPYSVVLFDEIEKGHPDIFNLLLQILDEGIITDAEGRKINFHHSVIILTSNIASEKFDQDMSFGFGENKNKQEKTFDKISNQVIGELSDYFRPELIDRLDKIVVFNSLSRKDLKKIIRLQLNDLFNEVKIKNIDLRISDKVINYLSDLSWRQNKGAREIKRNIFEFLEKPLAEVILDNQLKSKKTVKVILEGDKIKFKV